MSKEENFFIDLNKLKKKDKPISHTIMDASDSIAQQHGFIGRDNKTRGRKKSPRIGQIHAKVLPNISEEISNEAKRRGVQQGVIIEECWELYCIKNNTR